MIARASNSIPQTNVGCCSSTAAQRDFDACAACGAMAMLNQERVPCACEADVYGNVTTLMLQTLADAPVLMADLVDLDPAGGTGVFWHCGLAPLDMADPQATPHATIHSNRRKPLQEVAARHEMEHHFDLLLAAGEVGAWKPDPGLLQTAAERLNASN